MADPPSPKGNSTGTKCACAAHAQRPRLRASPPRRDGARRKRWEHCRFRYPVLGHSGKGKAAHRVARPGNNTTRPHLLDSSLGPGVEDADRTPYSGSAQARGTHNPSRCLSEPVAMESLQTPQHHENQDKGEKECGVKHMPMGNNARNLEPREEKGSRSCFEFNNSCAGYPVRCTLWLLQAMETKVTIGVAATSGTSDEAA
ncbi:hypothetical protein H8959_011027 [Pygathrix nigripes]